MHHEISALLEDGTSHSQGQASDHSDLVDMHPELEHLLVQNLLNNIDRALTNNMKNPFPQHKPRHLQNVVSAGEPNRDPGCSTKTS